MGNRIQGNRAVIWLIGLALLALQGCVAQAAALPQTAPDTPAVPVVRSAEVLRSTDPADIRVIARVELPNACYRLGDAAVSRKGAEFIVSLPAVKLTDQGCSSAPIDQDRVVQLASQPLVPGSYVILINGHLSTFSIVAPTATTVPAVQPTPPPTVVSAAAMSAAAAPGTAANTAGAKATPTPTAIPTPAPTTAPTLPPPPSPTPTATPLSLAVGQDTSGCVNRAAFYGDLTVPDGTPFATGQKFTKTWMVMNVGTCTWDTGYQLVFAGGDSLDAPLKLPLPKAYPRQVVQVSVDFTAPDNPRGYESDWAIQAPQGYTFGTGNPSVIPLAMRIVVAPRPVGVPSGLDCGALRMHDMELQVLDQINATRAQFNLYPYKLREDISQTALKHSLEMACYNRESHWGLDGYLYNVRLQRDNIAFATSNEIIYSGNGGPAGALKWWMNSHIHRPIVLSNEYTEIGIGFVYYDKNPYKQRITIDFIHP